MDEAEELHYSSISHDTKDLSELKLPAVDELSKAERAALEGIVWRKLDTRILPLCTGFFLLSFLVCLSNQFQAGHAQVRKMYRTGPISGMRV